VFAKLYFHSIYAYFEDQGKRPRCGSRFTLPREVKHVRLLRFSTCKY
jgi:hypothetical protein